MRLVISVDELHSKIKKGGRNLLVVDARSFAEYALGHVPGSVNIDLMQFHWMDTSEEGIRQFNRQMRMVLSNIGVSRNKFVVFYDNVSGPSAARGVWLLLYFSHNKVAMLNGGIESWKALYVTEMKTNRFRHTEFTGKPDRKVLADYKAVKSAMKKKNTIILDARSREEYNGIAVRANKAGHIPKAINIDWNENVHKQKFKDYHELEERYSKVPKAAQVITYCQGGYRAANSFVVLKMLGYENVRMYLGSWGEWGNKKGLPVSI